MMVREPNTSNIQHAEMAANQTIPPLDPANIDTTIKPTDNFYLYANGEWLKRNPVPLAYSRWGSFTELFDRNLNTLHEIADDASVNTNSKKGSNNQLVGDFYYSGMDTAVVEKEGVKPLNPYFKEIAAIKGCGATNALGRR